MNGLIDWIINFVADANSAAGLAALAGSAALEYVVPPFPGDTITLFGAVLITAYGWSFFGVFAAVMLGSLAGSMFDYAVGVRLRRRTEGQPGASLREQQLERLISKFRRHGAWYLVINRFLPGIRALFFVAAGMAGMRAGRVALLSAASAALWNLALIGVGSLVGANFETLVDFVRRYTLAVWISIGVVAALAILRAALRRRAPANARSAQRGGA